MNVVGVVFAGRVLGCPEVDVAKGVGSPLSRDQDIYETTYLSNYFVAEAFYCKLHVKQPKAGNQTYVYNRSSHMTVIRMSVYQNGHCHT